MAKTTLRIGLAVCCCLTVVLVAAPSLVGQTTVTTAGGTSGSIPVFTGASTVANSGISFGTGGLDVGNNVIHTGGVAKPTTNAQGAYIDWNYTSGSGEMDFINNIGLGIGGWWFYNQPGNPVGTATPVLEITPSGSLQLSKNQSITFGDGTVQSTAWSGTACITGGDYAESVDVTGERAQYEAGDVMTIDPEHPGNFVKSAAPYSTSIAGVYSTKPGFVGRRQPAEKPRDGEIPMAMVGIVPTKVSAENGAIHVGDLLVTSSSPGRVMKGTDRSLLTGAVVGKALGSLDSGTGVIEVLISLQ